MNTLHRIFSASTVSTPRYPVRTEHRRYALLHLTLVGVLLCILAGCSPQTPVPSTFTPIPPSATPAPTFTPLPPTETPIPSSPTPAVPSVSNGRHTVVLSRLEKKSANTVSPFGKPRPGYAYLFATLETDDPCFKPRKNGSCCGIVKTASGERFQPDEYLIAVVTEGAICQYLVPDSLSGDVTLSFTGYPDLLTRLK